MVEIKVGVIGGSGLGELLSSVEGVRRHSVETPFGRPSSEILETDWGGVPVFLLQRHGVGHVLNPTAVPYRANIYALKSLGVTHVLASGAVGSLRQEIKPRDLVILDQIIDKTTKRAGTFYEHAAVHVEFAQPFDGGLRNLLIEAAKAVGGATVHERGTYVCMEGPAFSTRAESLMHRVWGGDVIGMTAMPEAKLAREAEMAYAMIALATDYDCWRNPPAATTSNPPAAAGGDEASLLMEIIGNLKAASANTLGVMKKALELLPSRAGELEKSGALHALRLGIWSDKSKIATDEVARLGVLWGRYFVPAEAPPEARVGEGENAAPVEGV